MAAIARTDLLSSPLHSQFKEVKLSFAGSSSIRNHFEDCQSSQLKANVGLRLKGNGTIVPKIRANISPGMNRT